MARVLSKTARPTRRRAKEAPAPGHPASSWALYASAGLSVLAFQSMFLMDGSRNWSAALPTVALQALLWLGLGLWAYLRGSFQTLSLPRALAWAVLPWLLVAASLRAATAVVDFIAIVPLALANLLFWYAALGPQPGRWKARQSELGEALPELSEGAALAWGLGVSLAVGLGTLWIRNWAVAKWPIEVSDFEWFYTPRWRGFSGAPGGANAPLSQLAYPLAFLAELALVAWALRARKAGEAALMAALWILAVTGKFYIARISVVGVDILRMKIESEHNNFYLIAIKAMEGGGLRDFITHFAERMGPAGNQQETHPIGGTLFYAALVKAFGKEPQSIGFFLAGFYALALLPIYLLGRDLAGSRWGGFAAGLLYVSSPFNLQLSSAGIEPMVLLLAASYLWLLVSGLRRRQTWKLAAAGAVAWVSAMTSFATLSFQLFCGLWILVEEARDADGWREWLRRCALDLGVFFGAMLVAFVLNWLLFGCHLDYLTWLRQASGRLDQNTRQRPYQLWVWANVLLYTGYAGVGVVGLYLAQTGRWIGHGLRGAPFLALAQGTLLLFILLALGRAENQHNMMWADLLLLLPASGLLLRAPADARGGATADDDGARLRLGLLLGVAALNILNMAVLEMTILDYW